MSVGGNIRHDDRGETAAEGQVVVATIGVMDKGDRPQGSRGKGAKGAAGGGKLAMGELEASVMEVLWDAGGWLTPGEVHEVLAQDRALGYTTVMTILVRLWKKGRLERQRDGRAFAYRPLQTREEHAALRMSEWLDAVRDRPRTLAHFLSGLGSDERVQLRRLLQGPGKD